MFDPAALGTLVIGLDSARNASDASETSDSSVRAHARRSRPFASSLRVRLAGALRLTADRLDWTPPAGTGSSESRA